MAGPYQAIKFVMVDFDRNWEQDLVCVGDIAPAGLPGLAREAGTRHAALSRDPTALPHEARRATGDPRESASVRETELKDAISNRREEQL